MTTPNTKEGDAMTTEDLDARIAALTAAETKMTPRPWITRPDLGESWAKSIYTSPGYSRIIGDLESVADAAGIVALRNDAPGIIAALVAENAGLRAELDAAAKRGQLEQHAWCSQNKDLRSQLAAALAREKGLREALKEIDHGIPVKVQYVGDHEHLARDYYPAVLGAIRNRARDALLTATPTEMAK